jgi:Tfp pilus assembly protein PilO
MIVFKILLIILISAPVVGLGWFLYAQVNRFAKRKNAREKQIAAEIGRRRG